MDNKKLIVLFIILGIFLLLAATPAFAKEKVKIKITQDEGLEHKGYIVIKLLDSNGRPIKSTGTIHYNITDSNGYYKWAYKSYGSGLRLKYDVGTYKVVVKFDGDSKYSSAKNTQTITVRSVSPYDYYDSHNWGLNQEIDDYIEYNYWDEEIYDDPYTYDGEGP